MKRKKLLIDANPVVPYYVSGKTNGIGRTTRELIQTLDTFDDLPFDIELFSQNMKGIGGKNLNTHFKCHHLYLPHRSGVNKVLAKTPVRELMTGYDIMHIPCNFEYVHSPERCIVTVHDAMFFSHPEDFLGHKFARENYPGFARKCKAVITCSENSKREIAEYMYVKEERIFVCPWGVDTDIFHPQKKTSNRFTGDNPFFLSVSCSVGRKNTVSVVKAYELFARQNPSHHLILVWGNPPQDILGYVRKAGLEGTVHFVSDVSNEELSSLYANATATFFPSKYEGFGLPVLESLASGTPVVTCRNSSLPEVGGDAALYVEPEDIEAMSRLMEQFENHSLDLPQMQQKCLEQASKFSWRSCAEKTLQVYKECLG